MAQTHFHQIEGASPEAVALKLLQTVMDAEHRGADENLISQGRQTLADRPYILDTYAECLRAVTDPNSRVDREALIQAMDQGRQRAAQRGNNWKTV